MSTRLIPAGWTSLAYWQTGEWQVVKERLEDEVEYNPAYRDLFASLRAVRPESCRVAIIGQDPYPQLEHCTGIAFSCPAGVTELPPSLVNIFKEYQSDLGYPAPKNGDLSPWCEQGVLLWNAYPSCKKGSPGSHHWEEWTWLTKEIVEKLDGQVVFVFLGGVAATYGKYINNSPTFKTSHPSPLGYKHGFCGSRLFTNCNTLLVELGKKPINWRLPDAEQRSASMHVRKEVQDLERTS